MTTFGEKNADVKSLITKLQNIMDTFPKNRWGEITTCSKDWLLDYINEYDNTIKYIQSKIDRYTETATLRLQMDLNKSCRASLVYCLNNKKKRARKYITSFFNLSQQTLDKLFDATDGAKMEMVNSVDGNETIEINNDNTNKLIQEKFQMDYQMFGLFYECQFKEKFVLGEYEPKKHPISDFEYFKLLLNWKFAMEDTHSLIKECLIEDDSIKINYLKKRKIVDEWCYENHNECICETGGCAEPTYDEEEEIDGEIILI